MGKYVDNPVWSDLEPIEQDDGGPNPLAQIAYPEEYSEAMSYLRAAMAKNDISERVLDLTKDIISMNPAHYTVWLYRAKALFALNSDIRAELTWLNDIALRNLKNYQIWHHRQTIVDKLGSSEGEADFVKQMFEQDTKNYHVWSYKQWLVKRFDLWSKGEIEDIEEMLKEDVRNNSAWNHRWFVVFGNDQEAAVKDQAILKRELDFAKAAILLAPQNQSPWNYLRGLIRISKLPAASLEEFAEQFASLESPENVRSSHALDLLADAYAEEGSKKEKAVLALDLLARKYDPVRANYWNYRKSLLDASSVAA